MFFLPTRIRSGRADSAQPTLIRSERQKKKELLFDYRCDKCNKSFDGNEIKSINDSMIAELKSTDRSDPDALDAFLKDNATTLPDR